MLLVLASAARASEISNLDIRYLAIQQFTRVILGKIHEHPNEVNRGAH